MMGRRLLLAVLVGAACAPHARAEPARVLGVRHSSGPERTRVVLDLNVPAAHSVRRESNPERIVIEVLGADIAPAPARELADGRIRRINVNNLPSRAQVVLDMEMPHEFAAFTLPAEGSRQFRVVVDVLEGSRPSAAALAPPQAEEPYVVVVDAGHGGHDSGTRGCGIAIEKRVTLGIARHLATALSGREGIRVVMTREDDRFVPLGERVAIARRARGDLFVSVHANSAKSRRARGAEVFFLSPRGATDQAAAELADRENAAALVGVDEGHADDDDLVSILMDLRGSAILHRSELLAGLALTEIERDQHIHGRAVRQARFAVLRTLSMPSILVEAGFLSNPQEAERLRSSAGQQELGAALARSVVQYLERYGEKRPRARLLARRTHTVQRGDTLWNLARTYRTTVTALRDANALGNSRLRVGQKLVVP